MLSILPQLLDFQFYAPLLLRLALGAVFLIHGYPKLFGDRSQFAGWLASMGFKPGWAWALLVAIVEVVAGALLVIGLFTQAAALVLAVELLIIILWFKRGQKFVGGPASPAGGWEFDFVLLIMALALLILGPGAWAFDLPL